MVDHSENRRSHLLYCSIVGSLASQRLFSPKVPKGSTVHLLQGRGCKCSRLTYQRGRSAQPSRHGAHAAECEDCKLPPDRNVVQGAISLAKENSLPAMVGLLERHCTGGTDHCTNECGVNSSALMNGCVRSSSLRTKK
jgi:hypothetical protein